MSQFGTGGVDGFAMRAIEKGSQRVSTKWELSSRQWSVKFAFAFLNSSYIELRHDGQGLNVPQFLVLMNLCQ